MRNLHEKQENFLQRIVEVLKTLPIGIKELRESSKKREEDYKYKITFL
jgi:hypothetical protein